MTRSPYAKLDQLATSLFKDALPRRAEAAPRFQAGEGVCLDDPDGRATAAIGALLVWKLIQHGGCLLPVGPARQAVEQLMEGFPETDRGRLERESAEILRWLEDSLSLLDGEWNEGEDAGIYPWEDRQFPDAGKERVIRNAIDEAADLEIEYYTYSRNALTRRRVTPLEIDGGSMLRAMCHWRRDERHFLLSRIKDVRPLSRSSSSR